MRHTLPAPSVPPRARPCCPPHIRFLWRPQLLAFAYTPLGRGGICRRFPHFIALRQSLQ
jgi:hypothetical protein